MTALRIQPPARTALPARCDQRDALAAAIRRRRHALRVTQVALSGAAGLNRQHINRIERGVYPPQLDTLWRIAAALRTCPSALLADAEDLLAERTGGQP